MVGDGMSNNLLEFSGLVFKTAQMFAEQVKFEQEDLAQELWIVVFRATNAYNSKRSAMELKPFVYGCIANRVKDLKRNAARRAKYGVHIGYIEDYRFDTSHGSVAEMGGGLDPFESRYASEWPEQVYDRIEDGVLTVPSTVTRSEAEVLVMMMFDYSESELMQRFTLTRASVRDVVQSLRVKLADWPTTARPGPRQPLGPEALALAGLTQHAMAA